MSFRSFSIATMNHKRISNTFANIDHTSFVDVHGVLYLLCKCPKIICQIGIMVFL